MKPPPARRPRTRAEASGNTTADGYRAATKDERREADAEAWSEALLSIFDGDRW